jgi:DNA-binding NtrC family response regulator
LAVVEDKRVSAEEILADIESGTTDQRIHFVTYWEPSAQFDVYAPRGIRLWAQVLRDRHYEGKEKVAYFGKISISDDPATGEPKLGINPDDISELNRRIQRQNKNNGETHLYMWTAGHADKGVEDSLHVGKVFEISVHREDFLSERSDSPIPLHFYKGLVAQKPERYDKTYRNTNRLFPVWFKLKDIRQLDFAHCENLRVRLEGQDFQQFDPRTAKHRTSPLIAREYVPKSWFRPEELSEKEWKGWWEEVLLGFGDWDTGQFHNTDLKEVYAEALRFSKFNVPILILGQRGVGKTFLARWIRSQSPFQNKKFTENPKAWPQVACGSFSKEDLLLSELFGHVKGAFTDAVADRNGRLATLNGDTLFLDEIGDMSRRVQRALIKAIEEKQYQPLGADTATQESRFRLITATNKPWSKLKQDLDSDFLDRISDVVLRLPPLKEMRDDIPWLWRGVYWKLRKALEPDIDRILEERRKVHRKESPPIVRQLSETDEDLLVECLQKHSLPGNFRDLRALALHVIATLCDPTRPKFNPEEIIQKALPPRDDAPVETPAEKDVSRQVASAFAHRQSLDTILTRGTRLNYGHLERELKRYVAEQVIRISKQRGENVDMVCEAPSERTLYDWKKKQCL